jgi:cardiolipin synthase
VKVEIIVPGKYIDSKIVRFVSRHRCGDLIKAGIQIYEYQPTMMHVKLLIVDSVFVSVGSGNFDGRSLRLNDEANLDVMDAHFAAEQTRLFEQDKKKSRSMTLKETKGLNPLHPAAEIASPEL